LLHENAIHVAHNTPEPKNLNISVRLKALLAAPKTRVRQTIGFADTKRIPQNQKNQVKISLFRIVLPLGEKWGAQLGCAKNH